MKMYVVRDNVANTFYAPFVEHNDNSARRYFNKIVASLCQTQGFESSQFSLERCGEFSERTGVVTGVKNEFVCYGNDCEVSANESI